MAVDGNELVRQFRTGFDGLDEVQRRAVVTLLAVAYPRHIAEAWATGRGGAGGMAYSSVGGTGGAAGTGRGGAGGAASVGGRSKPGETMTFGVGGGQPGSGGADVRRDFWSRLWDKFNTRGDVR